MRTAPLHPLIATAHTKTLGLSNMFFTEGNPSITVDLPHDDDDGGADAGPGRGGEGGREEPLLLSLLPFFLSLSFNLRLSFPSPLPLPPPPPHAAFPQLLGSV